MLVVIYLQARRQPLGVRIVDWNMVVDWWAWTILLFHCHCLNYFHLLYLIAEDDQTSLSMSASGTISNAWAPVHFNNGCLLTPVLLQQQQAHTPNHCRPLLLIALPPLVTSLLSSCLLLCCLLLHHCLPSAGASTHLPIMSDGASVLHFPAPLSLVVPI